MTKRFVSGLGLSVVVAALMLHACVEPPPKIAAIPSTGLKLRLYVFGASAQDARKAFEAVRQNNQGFSLVNEGGDGDVLVGLENDSPKCVPPTALCSYRVAYRVRDNNGATVHAATTAVSANAERCTDLCSKALNNMVVKVVEAAAAALKGGAVPADDASIDPDAGVDAEPPDAALAAPPPPPPPPRGKRAPKKPPEPPPPPSKAPPAICSVGTGPRLPSDEAEKRAAQVEVLKRLNVIDQEEYDCLRKAYLDRL